MIERKGYRYRIYPTPEQEQILLRTFGSCRFLWNLALAQKEWFSRPGRRIGFFDQSSELAALKSEFPWFKDAPHHCLVQTLRDLDRAFVNFFQGRSGYPRPRRRDGADSCRFPDPAQFKIEPDPNGVQGFANLVLPKLGLVRLRLHRPVLGRMKNITVSRDGSMWVVSVQAEREIEAPASRLTEAPIGIDLGVARPVTLSTGEVFDVPRVTEQERAFVARLQRQIQRKRKGSRNRNRAVLRLRRRTAAIARRRKDSIEKITTSIARRHGVVFVEDIDFRNLTRSAKGTVAEPGRNVAQKSGLNRSILDVSPGQIRLRLCQKVDGSGGAQTQVVARNTSLRCNACGAIDALNRRSQTDFVCVACGRAANADYNAACNIRDRGSGLWGQGPRDAQGAGEINAGGHPVSACGGPPDSARPRSNESCKGPMKQETQLCEKLKVAA